MSAATVLTPSIDGRVGAHDYVGPALGGGFPLQTRRRTRVPAVEHHRALLDRFADHLRVVRNLAPSTVSNSRHYVACFLGMPSSPGWSPRRCCPPTRRQRFRRLAAARTASTRTKDRLQRIPSTTIREHAGTLANLIPTRRIRWWPDRQSRVTVDTDGGKGCDAAYDGEPCARDNGSGLAAGDGLGATGRSVHRGADGEPAKVPGDPGR